MRHIQELSHFCFGGLQLILSFLFQPLKVPQKEGWRFSDPKLGSEKRQPIRLNLS